jgi:hypothetical protein
MVCWENPSIPYCASLKLHESEEGEAYAFLAQILFN